MARGRGVKRRTKTTQLVWLLGMGPRPGGRRKVPGWEDRRPRHDHAGLLEHGAVQAGRIEAEQVDVNVGSEGLEELEGLQGQPAALPEMRHDEQDSDL